MPCNTLSGWPIWAALPAAADQLGVDRSVVTRRIAALEEHLGVKLITRTTRKLTLTSAGVV